MKFTTAGLDSFTAVKPKSNKRAEGLMQRSPEIEEVMVSTTFSLEGYRITEYKGIVRGIVVRAPTIPQGIFGRIKNVIGGRIGAYSSMCEQARSDAYEIMLHYAKKAGANAVVGVRFDAAEVVAKHSATEVLCYGTAVVVKPLAHS